MKSHPNTAESWFRPLLDTMSCNRSSKVGGRACLVRGGQEWGLWVVLGGGRGGQGLGVRNGWGTGWGVLVGARGLGLVGLDTGGSG